LIELIGGADVSRRQFERKKEFSLTVSHTKVILSLLNGEPVDLSINSVNSINLINSIALNPEPRTQNLGTYL
jgi:hypothetical protein